MVRCLTYVRSALKSRRTAHAVAMTKYGVRRRSFQPIIIGRKGKGYSRRVVSGSSVNVIANPVRVAPIPKVIAHVPTNISITASGAGL